jgi:hypothetical protein
MFYCQIYLVMRSRIHVPNVRYWRKADIPVECEGAEQQGR